MVTSLRWLVLALALAVVGCGGDDGNADPGTPIDCSWFAGSNCWKASAAAATACTDGSATGTFNGATTTCTYGDSTTIQFDPSASASASWNEDVPWDFTVISSTATTCARYKETDTSTTLMTSLGTFVESYAGSTVLLTCPDGSGFSIGVMDALSCNWADLPGTFTSGAGGWINFGFLGAPAMDGTLWRCGP
jgi:hypothetical protein